MTALRAIPVIARSPISQGEPEFGEYAKYESGDAERDAAAVAGPHREPWLNVLDAREQGSPPAIELALVHPEVAPLITGRAIDLGAGTCWVTARLSQIPRVTEVVALDMSERFLTDVGTRVIGHFSGIAEKIKFAVGSFNDIPFPHASFDCAFLVASIHHSLSPVKTLIDARRVLKPGGSLVVVEAPSSVADVRRRRRESITLSRATGATELCYTTGELDYMLRHAGFDRITYHPVDGLTRGRLRLAVRRGLRAMGLENFFKPPIYLIIARSGSAPE